MRRWLSVLLIVTFVFTLHALTMSVAAGQALTYQEGGPPGDFTDPALDVSPSLRRYVCSNGGSDSNDGLTQSTAWASINKINSSWGSIPPNAIIVLCRGGSWGPSNITNKAGTPNSPTAIGAYGACDPSPYFDNVCSNAPRISGTFSLNESSWITVRDLSARRYSTSFGSHHMLLYRNQGKGPDGGTASNIFISFGISHHMVFVENIATDANTNDYFVAHNDSSAAKNANRDGWWYIDNICVGSGGEDCIDMMNADPLQGTDPYITKDVKIVGNRLVGQPLAGYSSLTGTPANCNNSGHYGNYYWWVGNICLGFEGDWIWNFARQTDKADAQISGNIIIGDAGNGSMARNNGARQNTFHNTFVNGSATGASIQFRNDDQRFDFNLVLHNQSNSSPLVDASTQTSAIMSMNNNWYGMGADKIIVDGQTLSERQGSTQFDQESGVGDVSGFRMPTVTSFPNPNTWRDSAFVSQLTPGAVWAGCNGPRTPGARDCAGNYLGWELNPISGAPNNGCGWDGLPIVAAKMAELGITGSCAPKSDWTEVKRPEPPFLFSAQ